MASRGRDVERALAAPDTSNTPGAPGNQAFVDLVMSALVADTLLNLQAELSPGSEPPMFSSMGRWRDERGVAGRASTDGSELQINTGRFGESGRPLDSDEMRQVMIHELAHIIDSNRNPSDAEGLGALGVQTSEWRADNFSRAFQALQRGLQDDPGLTVDQLMQYVAEYVTNVEGNDRFSDSEYSRSRSGDVRSLILDLLDSEFYRDHPANQNVGFFEALSRAFTHTPSLAGWGMLTERGEPDVENRGFWDRMLNRRSR